MIYEHVVDVSYCEFAAIALFFSWPFNTYFIESSFSFFGEYIGSLVVHHCYIVIGSCLTEIVVVVDRHFPWSMLEQRVVEGQLQSASRLDSHAILHVFLLEIC